MCLLGNSVGDSTGAIIQAFEQNEKITTLLGVHEGATQLDLRKKSVDHDLVRLLAAELRVERNASTLVDLDISMNDIGLDGAKALAAVRVLGTAKAIAYVRW